MDDWAQEWEDARRFAGDALRSGNPALLNLAGDRLVLAEAAWREARADLADRVLGLLRTLFEADFDGLFRLVVEFGERAEWRQGLRHWFSQGPGSYRHARLSDLERRVRLLEEHANRLAPEPAKAAAPPPAPDWDAEQVRQLLKKVTDLSLRVRGLERKSPQ